MLSLADHTDSKQQQPAATESNGNLCVAPEVLVNGSPSPDIDGTVSGGDFSSIEEIQFVGIVNTPRLVNMSTPDQASVKQKRVCKIKCLNGVWIGPLCALENGELSCGEQCGHSE